MSGDLDGSRSGRRLGRYLLLETIGAGGMGVVYRAYDEKLGREVALKLLPSGALADTADRRIFQHEATMLSKLNHPNIEVVYDFDSIDDQDLLVIEYVPGISLDAKLAAGRLAEDEVVAIAIQLARGIAAAHEHGIVHRDLKPGNLRLTPHGILKILDFGLAKFARSPASASLDGDATRSLAQSGSLLVGTLPYMAPEQLRGAPADHRADVYAAGAVLYELATGVRPFPHVQPVALIDAILHCEPPPPRSLRPEISTELQEIILAALEKDPARRTSSAGDLGASLEALPGSGGATSPARASQHAKRHGTATPGFAPLPVRSQRRLWQRVRLPAIVLAALAVGGIGGWFVLHTRGGSLDSLAVVPFTNASADAALEFLSDGISASIAHSLSQIPTLKVMSHNSVAQFKGDDVDVRAAGRELGVRAIVLGRVVQQGSDLTISVELVDTRDRRLLWGDRYTRPETDILNLQAEITRQIAERLRLRLSGVEQRLARKPTDNPQAYRLYLQGRFSSFQWTTEGWKRGIELMQQAVELDPSYALAYAGLAASYLGASSLYLPPKEAMAKAKMAAQRALELDEMLSEAHATLAQVTSVYEWNWAAAERGFQRAITLNPSNAQAHLYQAQWLLTQGRADDAILAAERAQELDPLTPFVASNLAWAYYMARRYEEARLRLLRFIGIHPSLPIGHYTLGLVYGQEGNHAAALSSLRTARQLDPHAPFILSLLGHACGRAGLRQEALDFVAELQEMATQRYVDPFHCARVWVGLVDKDAAFAQLEAALAIRSEEITLIKTDPHFDSLRSDPRFTQLLQRLGLAP